MPLAEFRFYEELNDFLSPSRRFRTFSYQLSAHATAKHAIEALGVPHTEVELILVNGESVPFSTVIAEGDRVAVYPQFEALDVRTLLRVREQPLRVTRFIADAHLGRLARYLRLFGFDTLFYQYGSDAELVRQAEQERRIVLTRDRRLLMHRALSHGIYVRSLLLEEQLFDVLHRIDLFAAFTPFTRCMCCNGKLASIPKSAVSERVPPKALSFYENFYDCPGCGRIYWAGSHYRRLQSLIDNMRERHSNAAALTGDKLNERTAFPLR